MDSEFSGLKLLETKTFYDFRGYFRETYRESDFEASGKVSFVQDNEAFSSEAFILRGLHFQKDSKAQAKLVRAVSGSIFDVAVDLRPQSPTFGKWKGFTLSSETGASLFVPEGFAHGYLTLEKNTVVTYKVSTYYDPDSEGGIIWNDADLGIEWPLNGGSPIVSEKDARLPGFKEIMKN